MRCALTLIILDCSTLVPPPVLNYTEMEAKVRDATNNGRP